MKHFFVAIMLATALLIAGTCGTVPTLTPQAHAWGSDGNGDGDGSGETGDNGDGGGDSGGECGESGEGE